MRVTLEPAFAVRFANGSRVYGHTAREALLRAKELLGDAPLQVSPASLIEATGWSSPVYPEPEVAAVLKLTGGVLVD